MSKMVVKPPASAAREPCGISSLYSKPGSRRCPCTSISPGKRYLPRKSKSASSVLPSLILVIFPSRTSNVPSITPLGSTIKPLKVVGMVPFLLLCILVPGFHGKRVHIFLHNGFRKETRLFNFGEQRNIMIDGIASNIVIVIDILLNMSIHHVDCQVDLVFLEVGQDVGRALLMYLVEQRCLYAVLLEKRTGLLCGIQRNTERCQQPGAL